MLNDISIPMKNLAEAQAKERKSVNKRKNKGFFLYYFFLIFKIEDILNGKFKEWNTQKDEDNKVQRKEISFFFECCF